MSWYISIFDYKLKTIEAKNPFEIKNSQLQLKYTCSYIKCIRQENRLCFV